MFPCHHLALYILWDGLTTKKKKKVNQISFKVSPNRTTTVSQNRKIRKRISCNKSIFSSPLHLSSNGPSGYPLVPSLEWVEGERGTQQRRSNTRGQMTPSLLAGLPAMGANPHHSPPSTHTLVLLEPAHSPLFAHTPVASNCLHSLKGRHLSSCLSLRPSPLSLDEKGCMPF